MGRVPDAGWLLVCWRCPPALSIPPILPLHVRANWLWFVLANAAANSNYTKFDPYLFDPENVYQHGKNKAFENWGYTVKDAKWLQGEIERQAREKYVSDKYTLGKLDIRGQRINIRVTLPRKDGSGDVSFITGWMVLPNGKLKLNTPYRGK